MTLRPIAALTAALLFSLTFSTAYANSNDSEMSVISALPVASFLVSEASQGITEQSVTLSKAGAELVVKEVKASAHGTVYVLERVSDGAEASIEVVGNTAHAASLGIGSVVSVSIIGAGVVLSVTGEVIAFIPNEIGKALLHNERLTS